MSVFNAVLSLMNREQKEELREELDKIELASMNLKEGQEISAESFEVGQAVSIVAEDETKIPLPEGEYELEDGRRLVVDDQSIITEMKSSEEAKEEEKPADEIEEVKETEMSEEVKETEMAEEKKEEEKEEEKKEEMMEETELESKVVTIVKKEVEAMKEEMMAALRAEMESYVQKQEAKEEEDEKQKMSADTPAPKRLKPNPDKNQKRVEAMVDPQKANTTLNVAMKYIQA